MRRRSLSTFGTACRHRAAAVAVALAACGAGWSATPAAAADLPRTRTAPAGQALSVVGRENLQRLSIRRIGSRPTQEKVGTISTAFFCGAPRDIRFNDEFAKLVLRDAVPFVRRELTAAGYPQPLESAFNGAGADPEPVEYEMGITLVDVEAYLCGSGTEVEGSLWARLRWELFSPRERRVVFSVETEGSAEAASGQRKAIVDLTHATITSAARNLLALPAFADNATRRAAPRVNSGDQTALPLARRSASQQSAAEAMPALQSAVVTVFAGQGSGSGFYIHREGWLLTNQHVVGDARFVKVKLASGRELAGEVVRSAAARDVALIKTEPVALATFEVAATEAAPGDDVYVLGSPLGESLASTVTRGVLSASREVREMRWLQSDVKVAPGSSGGPMVNRYGAVVGLTSRGLGEGSAGINFFVPIADALKTLKIDYLGN